MEKICVVMPVVSECSATECAYNSNKSCQARAITVGDGDNAGCDTFWRSSQHASASECSAGVGACKMEGCMFNEGLECMAESIHVAHLQSKVNCMSFSARQ